MNPPTMSLPTLTWDHQAFLSLPPVGKSRTTQTICCTLVSCKYNQVQNRVRKIKPARFLPSAIPRAAMSGDPCRVILTPEETEALCKTPTKSLGEGREKHKAVRKKLKLQCQRTRGKKTTAYTLPVLGGPQVQW